MKISHVCKITLSVTALLVLSGTPSIAETVYEATITGSQVVPVTPSGAYGTVTLIVDDAGTEAAYTVNFAGLDGTQTAAHFHNAAPGENGSVLFTLPLGSPLAGMWPTTAFDVQELIGHRVYVSIHSDLFPEGEIRGDLELTMVEDTATRWGGIKALYR